jgi:signal transduction histidine kinase/CheY-like chemotaxis protein
MVFSMLNMAKDWRFKGSPHVEIGGLRAYCGVPLRFETEFGEHVAFGSLCVASNSEEKPLSKEQQVSLARLADWIVADIVSSARSRRQRERRRMQDLLVQAQRRCDMEYNMEKEILTILHSVYPSSTASIRISQNEQIDMGDGTSFPISEIESNLWEDCDYFDYLIREHNHRDPVASRTIRSIVAPCANARTPTYLVVGCNDFRVVFDDIDAWFVQMCSAILGRFWQNQVLKEALAAKEAFLRGITHHLRTPIHGILGSVDLLSEELKSRNILDASTTSSLYGSPSEEQIHALDPYMYIKAIRSSAKDLISTVNSLIKLNQWADVAEAERTIATYSIDEIEMALLNEITPMLPDDTFERPSIVIHHHLPQQSDMLTIDLRLFVDCIQPLFLNAVQNTPGNGVVSLYITVTDDYRSLVVDVEDTGRGISPENQQRVFNAYEKVDPHTPDAGLGLTLAAKLAGIMDGNLSLVSSKVNQGSHFRVVFNAPTCACAHKAPRRSRSNLSPATFHMSSSTTELTPLGRSLSRYLTSRGYTERNHHEGALSVLEYTPDITDLYRRASRVSTGQAAVCLVPEQDKFIIFANGRSLRDNNVLYIKGPFISTMFDEALLEIQSILKESAAPRAEPVAPPEGGVSISNPLVTPEQALGHLHNLPMPDLADQGSRPIPTADQNAGQDVEQGLSRSLLTLNIKQSVVAPVKQHRSKPRALLVDDNPVNLKLLEMYCTRRGLPYSTAKDGAQAVKLYSKACTPDHTRNHATPASIWDPFDFVLMDLQMPICDGITATREIRELEHKNEYPRSVIFIVTGQDSPSDRASAHEAGSDGYMVKPVGPKVMDRAIKQWFPDADLG